ncbi:MAG: 3'(2'),5'-bisphosphate nucleotidase CysQ [Chloroflexi bacterium]|nr:3'(2'),5'-bisphosphate nucleotidase CysQ [Chloroflexota bacterium]
MTPWESRFQRELDVAIAAARAAGDEVARMRREGLRYGRKEGYELVSEADIRAAEMLHEALTAPFPDTGWLSEEHTDTVDRLGNDRVWIVDPIDGTREFLQGIPEYAVSVGLAVEGTPVLGVVYNPASGTLAAAACEGAAEAGPVLLPLSVEVLVGRGEHEWNDIPPLPAGTRVTGMGSVAYRLAMLAGGRGDAVLTGFGRSEWDVAAGAALCLAAGLRVTDVLGEPLRFNQPVPTVRGLLVAHPAVHEHFNRWFRQLK